MPFSVREQDISKYGGDENHWHEVYHGLIIPAVKKAGIECHRDDEDSTSRLITEGIWRKLENADVVLCDLSATNPNVFLELGWALRSDRRFVLIKDDLTEFQFDLNQYFTFTYSNRLQPSTLARDVDELSRILSETLKDSQKRYSIVARLGIELTAIKAIDSGNIEMRLLQKLRDDVRSLKFHSIAGHHIDTPRQKNQPKPEIRCNSWGSLQKQLIGTQWTNTRSGDTIVFLDRDLFLLRRRWRAIWERVRYKCTEIFPTIILKWSDIGPAFEDFSGTFSDDFNSFLEDEQITWKLV